MIYQNIEAVEVCPYCEAENSFPGYDAEVNGYIVACQNCGKEIFLCDDCTYAEDNPEHQCDWHVIKTENGIVTSGCFRGVVTNPEKSTTPTYG